MVNTSDYYPFGFAMGGRSESSGDYRYGFNGKEKDDKGEWGNQTYYNTLHRIYNPGIGRWLSVDPIASSSQSPYTSMDNRPITLIDPKGDKPYDRFYNEYGELLYDDGVGDDNYIVSQADFVVANLYEGKKKSDYLRGNGMRAYLSMDEAAWAWSDANWMITKTDSKKRELGVAIYSNDLERGKEIGMENLTKLYILGHTVQGGEKQEDGSYPVDPRSSGLMETGYEVGATLANLKFETTYVKKRWKSDYPNSPLKSLRDKYGEWETIETQPIDKNKNVWQIAAFNHTHPPGRDLFSEIDQSVFGDPQGDGGIAYHLNIPVYMTITTNTYPKLRLITKDMIQSYRNIRNHVWGSPTHVTKASKEVPKVTNDQE